MLVTNAVTLRSILDADIWVKRGDAMMFALTRIAHFSAIGVILLLGTKRTKFFAAHPDFNPITVEEIEPSSERFHLS